MYVKDNDRFKRNSQYLRRRIHVNAVMNAITISLQPIKVGIERLGRSNATLLDAEGALIFIIDNFGEKNNFFC